MNDLNQLDAQIVLDDDIPRICAPQPTLSMALLYHPPQLFGRRQIYHTTLLHYTIHTSLDLPDIPPSAAATCLTFFLKEYLVFSPVGV